MNGEGDWQRAFGSQHGGPVAVVDIGSNSIRMVVYETAIRSPTVLFNEKALCGLGRRLATTGRLSESATERALVALRRFSKICEQVGVKRVFTVATEAVRRAANGPEFIARAGKFVPDGIRILSGKEEAELAAAGIAAGFVDPDGVAGDLGGGSLELINLRGASVLGEASVPLGSLNLMDLAGNDPAKAAAYVDQHLQTIPWLGLGRGRPFYAIGGTWRALARLHMAETRYPLNIVQHYTITPRQLGELYANVMERQASVKNMGKISTDRRDMLPYGLLVLKRLVDRMQPSGIVFSVFGVREGLVYRLLPEPERVRDPLIAACEEMAGRRARSPRYGYELFHWMHELFQAPELIETIEERRLRLGACLLTDVGWRGHPDYRGEKVLGLIAQSSFAGIDHPGRAFLALAVYYHYQRSLTGSFSPALRKLINRKRNRLTKVIAVASRAACKLSANMPGILCETQLSCADGGLVLHLPKGLEALDGESLRRRFKTLADLMKCDFELRIETRRRTLRASRAADAG